MGASEKQILQVLTSEGKPAKTADSIPGCFVLDGKAFSTPQKGNALKHYVNGVEYFKDVAAAIENATASIFIAGWQVNYDVLLTGSKTLWDCLRGAIDKNPGVYVYVMPWMSPKIGVDTGDLETALAVIQLNAGLTVPRAFVLPAVSQCDQPGALGIAFSHHQKLVVIDNRTAFVGGLDLAYGRRDDGRCSLKAEGRSGNEFYNACIPPIHALTRVEQTAYLTRAELLAACFDTKLGRVAQFIFSAPVKEIAGTLDLIDVVTGKIKDIGGKFIDWWSESDVIPDFIRQAQDKAIDAVQDGANDLSKWAYQKLGAELQQAIGQARDFGGAQLKSSSQALMAWLNGASLESLPPGLLESTAQTIHAFSIRIILALQMAGSQRKSRYPNLLKLKKTLPAGGSCHDVNSQPRMPWHDVHCRISGPSVFDLSRNFIRRWNGIAKQYEDADGKVALPLLRQLGITGPLKVPRIASAHRPVRSKEQSGSCWVQVVRSAPLKMKKAEAVAELDTTQPTLCESSCLSAMVKNIREAVHFVYIEGQFFQSEHGDELIGNAVRTDAMPTSGPMHALMDVRSSLAYKRYAVQLGINDKHPSEFARYIRWSQVDNIRRDKKGGKYFVADLKRMMATQTQIAGSRVLGPSQRSLENPICESLGERISRAIRDDLPFHAYLVLPVHPEGTLDTINIMTQQYLTMQSLVFGSHSLINRIRRALLARIYLRNEKLPWQKALQRANSVPVGVLQREIPDASWRKYLTLLNLRNWTLLAGRPVTEQIYVHSKLLIADDRAVVLGSANINDRSQLGGRDSELAVVIHDDGSDKKSLDGKKEQSVGTFAGSLRRALWRKHFGLDGGVPANQLVSCIDKPSAPDTILAIQRLAAKNAKAYSAAFKFLPSIDSASSIWPTWREESNGMSGFMPFNEQFWSGGKEHEHGWGANKVLPESAPVGVEGFIVSLPTRWTEGENNFSGMNLTALAVGPDRSDADGTAIAKAGATGAVGGPERDADLNNVA
ncbi:phospholipase [Cupriavidus nantongensis]|uniref:phospholipase n=1 Tax=Cupriavidus nantongensis TaxID=1796606 RepID=UPI00358E4CF1